MLSECDNTVLCNWTLAIVTQIHQSNWCLYTEPHKEYVQIVRACGFPRVMQSMWHVINRPRLEGVALRTCISMSVVGKDLLLACKLVVVLSMDINIMIYCSFELKSHCPLSTSIVAIILLSMVRSLINTMSCMFTYQK